MKLTIKNQFNKNSQLLKVKIIIRFKKAMKFYKLMNHNKKINL